MSLELSDVATRCHLNESRQEKMPLKICVCVSIRKSNSEVLKLLHDKYSRSYLINTLIHMSLEDR